VGGPHRAWSAAIATIGVTSSADRSTLNSTGPTKPAIYPAARARHPASPSGEFLITSAKRLFQQHRSKPEVTALQQQRPVHLEQQTLVLIALEAEPRHPFELAIYERFYRTATLAT
jgi:hypothetical protein